MANTGTTREIGRRNNSQRNTAPMFLASKNGRLGTADEVVSIRHFVPSDVFVPLTINYKRDHGGLFRRAMGFKGGDVCTASKKKKRDIKITRHSGVSLIRRGSR